MEKILCILLAVCFLVSCDSKKPEKTIYNEINPELEKRAQEITDSIEKSLQMGHYLTANDLQYKDSIDIVKAWLSSKNSVGGFEVHVKFKNKAHRVIKYASLYGRFYNAVDDEIETSYAPMFCRKETGPIKYNHTNNASYYWGLYYGWDVKYMKLFQIDIEYMDGTKVSVPVDYTTAKIR